jgi:hypothetical protein
MEVDVDFKSLVDLDFHYSVDVDYDTDSSGCQCEDYCRCSRIENTRVNSVSISSLINTISGISIYDTIKKTKTKKNDDEIFNYCLERILVALKLYRKDIWDISVRNGYYGEEIGSVVLDKDLAEAGDEWITKLNNTKKDDDRIRLALEAEYGYILGDLKNANFSIEEIYKSDIYFGQETYRKKVVAGDLIYNDYKGICGICHKEGSKYRIIDGYHRCCSVTTNKIKVISY